MYDMPVNKFEGVNDFWREPNQSKKYFNHDAFSGIKRKVIILYSDIIHNIKNCEHGIIDTW